MDLYGPLSLVPIILTIIIAIRTKNVIIALFIGVFSGVLILNGFHPINSLTTTIQDYFFVQLTDSYNAGVMVLLLFIGGFVILMEKSGGAAAFAAKAANVVNTKCKAQISAWLAGILVFFSDLGTPLIVGPIFEKLFDKKKISREKLAWIVDTTSSPVAVLIPIIGWSVYIMGLIQKEYNALGILETDWNAFLKAIPFQFYPILSLIMVPLVAFTGFEFSQMKKAEKRVQDGKLFWESSKPLRKYEELEVGNSKPILVWLPLLVLLVSLFGILAPYGFPFKKVDGGIFRAGLSSAYLFSALTIIILMVKYKVKSLSECFDIYFAGMNRMMSVAIILVLAWSLGAVGKELGTAEFITQLTGSFVPGWAIPAVVFVIGGIVSFATGSSWGTFAIMIPIVIPMAFTLDASMHVCIGAVISGGLFGDHCSPISDTTILSSTGAGCDLVDHVKTQLPYALLNGGVSVFVYLIAGVTGAVWTLGLAIALMIFTFILISKYYGEKEDLIVIAKSMTN